MRKRLCKATKNKKTIPRADRKYQRLWEEMSGSIRTGRLDEILSILEPLPIINKKAHFVRKTYTILGGCSLNSLCRAFPSRNASLQSIAIFPDAHSSECSTNFWANE